VVLPATGAARAPDPLVFLAGGGVAPATRYAPFLSKAFAHLRRERDILLVDQRGTGGSNALACDLSTDPTDPIYRDEARFLDAVSQCRAALERHADLRFYTTPLAMDDLDEVRAWLGYPRLNLYGASYGTRAAMVYVRQHREHVRTVALQGVVPIDVPMWLEVSRSSQEVLDRAFAACAHDARCHDAFPEPGRELEALLLRLSSRPVRVTVRRTEKGAETEVTIDDNALRTFLVRELYDASRSHKLPLLIHLASTGDLRPVAAKLTAKDTDGIPKGIYFSIVCSEDIPLFDAGALPAATAGTFLLGRRVGRDVSACGRWVRGWLPPGFVTPITSDVPALVMNGELDAVTPPRYGEHVAQTLSHARRLVLPGRGHNDVDPCVTGIVEALVAAGDPAGIDTNCLAKPEQLPFPLRVEDLED
jgi:pimeloyl-ACP methyl ester carboxylesterase